MKEPSIGDSPSYFMTRVDIVPILLEDLPFHGLMRGSTEGGERSHYFHQSLYCSKSSRGGGWKKPDPVLNIFQWMYRSIRERTALTPVDIQEKFEEFVKDKLEVQRDTQTEVSLTLLALGAGVFHVNFVCLLITFLVLGELPPNLVTFHNWVLAKFSISKIKNRGFLVAMVISYQEWFFAKISKHN